MRQLNLVLRPLITLPGVPPSSNTIYTGMFWRKRAKIAEDWHMLVLQAVKFQEPLISPVALSITLCFGKGNKIHPVRRYDASNASFALKLIEDGLVAAKVLKGDGSKHVGLVLLSCRRSEDGVSRTIVEYAEV